MKASVGGERLIDKALKVGGLVDGALHSDRAELGSDRVNLLRARHESEPTAFCGDHARTRRTDAAARAGDDRYAIGR
jgi:hypothetical protein